MPNPPSVSALVLNYRSHRDAVKCAEALQKQSIADRMEILVIDNHSDDESIAFIRARLPQPRYRIAADGDKPSFPNVRILESRENIGYGRGNNMGAAMAKGEYLLIINPDNVLPVDGLERMLSYLQKNSDVGVVGPALVYPDGNIRPSARPLPKIFDLLRKRIFPAGWHQKFDVELKAYSAKDAVEVGWLVGACLLMKTELFRKLGGFDERFFLFFEDIDLCRRIKNEGKKVIYLPQVRVSDRKGRLSGSSALSLLSRKTTWIHLSSAIKYFWKWKVEG